MLSFSVSSFERRLFLLAIAKLGDYLSLYGVLVIGRVVMWFPRVFIGIPWVFACAWRRRLPRPRTDVEFFRRGRRAP